MDNKYQFRTLRQLLQKFRVIRLLVLLIICIMSIVLISGCSFEPVTLTFVVTKNEVEDWKPLINQFEAKYHIKINLNPAKANVPDASDKVKTALVCAFEEKKPYDLLYLDIVWVPEFAERDWLTDLTKEFQPEELKKEGFLVNKIENGLYKCENCKDSKLYRVPFRTDIGVLYYRKDLVKQAEIPKTFDDLKKISKDLQDKLRAKTTEKDSWGYLWTMSRKVNNLRFYI